MNKTEVLVKALRKNGRSMSAVNNMGKKSTTASLVEFSNILVPVILAVASGALGWALSVGPWSGFMNLGGILELLSTVLVTMTVILSLMQLISSLYLSDDLQVLLTLPFSEQQITVAKIRIVAEKQYLYCASAVIPVTAVWAVLAGATKNELIAAATMVLLLPGIVMCVIGIVIIILMRFVGILRSKNLLKMIGSIVGVGLAYVVYFFIVGHPSEGDGGIAASLKAAMEMSDSLRTFIPTTGLIADIIETGNLTAVLIMIAALIISFVLLAVSARALYLKAALSMSEAASGKRVLKEAELRKYMTSHDLGKALVKRDRRIVLRTPAFLTAGVIQPLMQSIVMLLICIVSVTRVSANVLNGRTASVTVVFGLTGLIAAITLTTGATSAAAAFSREGISFAATKTLPIAPEMLLRAKRNTAMHFGIACATIPTAIAMLALCGMGKLAPLALPYVPGFSFTVLWISAEILILFDLKEPNLIWENPGDLKKNTLISFLVVIGACALTVGAMALTLLLRIKFKLPYGGHVVYAVVTILSIAGAAAFDKYYIKKGKEYLARL